ncbi:MAG TPA: CHASE2 domain-containing protein [Caulobacteraceae bacterium]|nr:CHASE2 domain-containing protein [Caulobacteraceae bacterium]
MAGPILAGPNLAGLTRRVAAGVLLLFLFLQVAAPSLFVAPRLALFDLYQRVAPRHRDPAQAPVVIVAVDDPSLKAIGQWPWPRAVQARLVKAILGAQPAALGVDVLWSEPGAGDDALAQALGDGPAAIGLAGVKAGQIDADTGPLSPVIFHGPAGPIPGLPYFPSVLRSLSAIDLAAPGHGVMSNDPDGDGVFRHLRLLSSIAGRVTPDLSLEVYRLAARASYLSLYTAPDGRGLRGIGVGPSTFPTEPDGALWIDYTPRDEWPLISAADVLAGRVRPQAFDGRLVLIGLTGTGLVDQMRKTPVESMSGIEIRAQGLENLLAGRLASRPAWAPILEVGLTLVLGLFLMGVLPAVRRLRRFAAAPAPFVLLGVLGVALWSRYRLMVDVATPALACGTVLVALLGGGLAEVDAQRRRLRRDLELGRLAAARAEGELEAARRIQMGILPKPEALASDPRFDLDAVMEPARQIGGDLYDFFKIDADHLFIAVGDVSGKGLPAALFMALGKSLCMSCALRGETDIGAIVRRANAEISRDNPEMLFITLYAAILDLETGLLSFCNAGHDPPFLLRAGDPAAAITGEGGPPLCVMDDFPYRTETRQLAPGDLVCVTTDGVTEAMTAAGVLIGRPAVERILAALPADAGAREVTAALRAAVAAFVAGAEPSDDLTILTIRWRGAAPLPEGEGGAHGSAMGR